MAMNKFVCVWFLALATFTSGQGICDQAALDCGNHLTAIPVPEDCNEMVAYHFELEVCLQRYDNADPECQIDPTYFELRQLLDSQTEIFESQCERSCEVTGQSCVTQQLQLVQNLCQVTDEDIDNFLDCMEEELKAKSCPEETINKVIAGIRNGITENKPRCDLGQQMDACISQTSQPFSQICSVAQEELTCMKNVIDKTGETLNESSTIFVAHAYLNKYRLLGCSNLKWGDDLFPTKEGCNIRAAMDCYNGTPMKELVDEYDYSNGRVILQSVFDQQTICRASKDTDISTLTQCLQQQLGKCFIRVPVDSVTGQRLAQPGRIIVSYLDQVVVNSEPSNDGYDGGNFNLKINFLNINDLDQIKEYCGQECDQIEQKAEQMHVCVRPIRDEIHDMVADHNCSGLAELVACEKRAMGTCLPLQRAWLKYSSKHLVHLAQECKTSLGTKECLLGESPDVDCELSFVASSYQGTTCSAYKSHLRCLESHTVGCDSALSKLIQPHLLPLAYVNEYYNCDLQYQGNPIQISEQDQCSLEHYVACFNPLTKAYGVGQLRTANPKSLELLTANVLSTLSVYDSTEACRLNADLLDECVDGIHQACNKGASAEEVVFQDPWMLPPSLFQIKQQQICTEGCQNQNLVPDFENCGSGFDFLTMCHYIELNGWRNIDPTTEDCESLESNWECMKEALGDCELMKVYLDESWGYVCSGASMQCFGKVLQVSPTPSTNPTVTVDPSSASMLMAGMGCVMIAAIAGIHNALHFP